MTPGEVGIDRNRGLHFTKPHFDLTGKDIHPPQGEMRQRLVRIERYRSFGRPSRRRQGFCNILGVAYRHRDMVNIREISMGRRKLRIEFGGFLEFAYGLTVIGLVEAIEM